MSAPLLHHFLSFLMVICFVSHGDLLFPLFGKCLSVTSLTLRSAVHHLILGFTLQFGQQVDDLLRYRTRIRIRMVNTVDTAAAPYRRVSS